MNSHLHVLRAFVVRSPGVLRRIVAFATLLATHALAADPPAATPAPSVPADPPTVFVVVGAPGEAEFGTNFVQQAGLLQSACEKAGAATRVLGIAGQGSTNDVTRLRELLDAEPKEGPDLWLIFVGHGTFDGREARFCMRGPDLSASDLSAWLKPFKRRLAIVNAASSSAPFLNKLSAPHRVVITATRSGSEQNFTRFGTHFAAAIADPETDLDKDGQTSLLEAFLSASFRVAEFYKSEGRLATEHALIDDNGDGLGTPAEWFRGLRATKRPRDGAAIDGLRAHQMHLIRSAAENELPPAVRARRDALELEIAALRERKSALNEDDYYRKLETLARELAQLYRAAGK